MTDNEIINALECCAEQISCSQHCPYWRNSKGCDYVKVKVILDLINRQKAEIERLQNNNVNIAKHCLLLFQENNNKVIKEFAERLKKCSQWLPLVAMPDPFVTVSDIDNLVKEMVGENNVPCN